MLSEVNNEIYHTCEQVLLPTHVNKDRILILPSLPETPLANSLILVQEKNWQLYYFDYEIKRSIFSIDEQLNERLKKIPKTQLIKNISLDEKEEIKFEMELIAQNYLAPEHDLKCVCSSQKWDSNRAKYLLNPTSNPLAIIRLKNNKYAAYPFPLQEDEALKEFIKTIKSEVIDICVIEKKPVEIDPIKHTEEEQKKNIRKKNIGTKLKRGCLIIQLHQNLPNAKINTIQADYECVVIKNGEITLSKTFEFRDIKPGLIQISQTIEHPLTMLESINETVIDVLRTCPSYRILEGDKGVEINQGAIISWNLINSTAESLPDYLIELFSEKIEENPNQFFSNRENEKEPLNKMLDSKSMCKKNLGNLMRIVGNDFPKEIKIKSTHSPLYPSPKRCSIQ